MPQHHLDRLTSIDASFLHQEGPASHMHIGAVLLFEGPPPNFTDYLDHVRGRLHLVPRYRQKLATPPLETGRPLWIDDESFNLEYHVRHAALPSPGTEDQLFQLTARVASQQLDRTKPLWESWLVEGLEDDRFALIFKTHHSLVDGVSGVDLATVLFDLGPEPAPQAADLEPWKPRHEPSPSDLILAGLRGVVTTSAEIVARAISAATRPASSFGVIRDAAEGIGEIVWAGLNPAPETPLNVEIGPHRRYSVVRQELAEYKEVKDHLGGTVNDVVLTVVSGALARWLRSRGVRTEGLEMRALVPVSVRAKDDGGSLGNKLTVMRGPLPVYVKDPVARLRFVRKAMDGLKESKQAVGAATLTAVNNLAPPTVLAQASRLNFSTRLFNLLVTNIPGPQLPLYVLGRRLEDLFPIAFLPANHALAIAIMSYDGGIDYGLLGDYDALPDIEVIADGIRDTLDELLEAARSKTARGGSGSGRRDADRDAVAAEVDLNGSDTDSEYGHEPAKIIPSSSGRSKHGPAADMRAKRARGDRPARKLPDG
ncbi:MAG TPA: wax ester/triacylglycerol synthase family O-acyltransferase [Solirubrobacteraceae bacterium]|nr:wax ester/triacylglycerol synthase family O-acyltransferase [Solirubrobacteraceae bacterium]